MISESTYMQFWCEDQFVSWGNIRRYPVESERNRTGGAGVYYHVSLIELLLRLDVDFIVISSTT
jgi:hypothetical protein